MLDSDHLRPARGNGHTCRFFELSSNRQLGAGMSTERVSLMARGGSRADRCRQYIFFIQLCTMTSVKVSLLLLYRRLFGVSRHFRLAVYGGLVVVVAYFISLVIVAVLSSVYVVMIGP